MAVSEYNVYWMSEFRMTSIVNCYTNQIHEEYIFFYLELEMVLGPNAG
jgi:hypothetical protein